MVDLIGPIAEIKGDCLDITFLTRPQLPMEATELVYLTMHHESYDDLKQRILLTYGAKYDREQEREFSARMDFLARLQERAETLLVFRSPACSIFLNGMPWAAPVTVVWRLC